MNPAPRRHPAELARSGDSTFYTAEEFRQFLQLRVGLFAKIGFWFLLANYLLTNGANIVFGAEALDTILTTSGSAITLLNLTAFGATWALCREGRHPAPILKLIDVALVTFFCATVALNVHLHRDDAPLAYLGAAIPATFAVLTRAVLIPGSARRACAIAVLSYLPLLLVSATLPEPARPAESPNSFLGFAITCLLGAALATVTAEVIHRLDFEVRKARRLGQYQLEEQLGAGAMGEVYRASHVMLRRPTAVKVLRPELAGDKNLARFEREVQSTSQLTHPNTVAIYDYGRTPSGTLYYAMEYLDGMTLQTLVERHGPLSPGRVIHVLKQVCASLEEAHAAGLIHRDIKPANIILCNRGLVHNFVKVCDFGLVRRIDSTQTTPRAITGTPLYMSPEAIRSPDAMDQRSDLYSLGAVGCFLLTGKHLFESDNVAEVCRLQVSEMPERPSTRVATPVPRDLEDAIFWMLAKDPNDRPAGAAAARKALVHCASATTWDAETRACWWEEEAPESRPTTPRAPQEDDKSVPSARETPTLTIDLQSRS